MNVKNHQLLWDLYVGITRDVKKTSGYYGNYMRVLQGMLKKPNDYHRTHMQVLQWMKNVNYYLWPIWRYCKECKMSMVIMGLICGYYKECKMPAAIMGLICGYCNECKMLVAILGLICGYYIFENGLMEFIIENDVGIICLKCVYCLKSLQVMWILLY